MSNINLQIIDDGSSSSLISANGVALSGLEFSPNTLPGALNTDYFISAQATWNYLASKGVNIVRLPFLWERLQPVLGGALNTTYLGYIQGQVAFAQNAGLKVILDCHNYGQYNISGTNHRIGTTQVTIANFANMWQLLATVFATNTTIIGYDTMNEPNNMPVATTSSNYNTTSTVTLMTQAAINAIRTVDSLHYIICELDNFAGGQNFNSQYGTNPTPWLTDSFNKLFYSFHYYFDNDHSGSYALPFSSANNTAITSDLTPLLSWSKTNNIRLYCGEFGVPAISDWQICLDTFLDLIHGYFVWWDYWAGGDAYTSVTGIQPSGSFPNYIDALQMTTLLETGELAPNNFQFPAITFTNANVTITIFAETTDAQVIDQGYTYDQAGFTYNQAGVVYGGLYNTNQDVSPSFFDDTATLLYPSISGIVDIYTPPDYYESIGPGFFMFVTELHGV